MESRSNSIIPGEGEGPFCRLYIPPPLDRPGLELVTNGIVDKYSNQMKLTPEERIEWRGGRDPRDPFVRADPIYKARPLNGIWAVSPYLHNGSAPNLYALLSAQSERPRRFWTGSKEFDSVKVGHDTTEIKGRNPIAMPPKSLCLGCVRV